MLLFFFPLFSFPFFFRFEMMPSAIDQKQNNSWDVCIIAAITLFWSFSPLLCSEYADNRAYAPTKRRKEQEEKND